LHLRVSIAVARQQELGQLYQISNEAKQKASRSNRTLAFAIWQFTSAQSTL